MKKILITGKNSYVGQSVENWLNVCNDKNGGEPLYSLTTLDLLDENWRDFDFNGFDIVFHVAGIAHIKESKKNKQLYYSINRDLAIEVAHKAMANNVKQFIFMSSMSLYDGYITMRKGRTINEKTPFKPKGYYGDSKRQADEAVQKMQSDSFNVAILRPPMIYGPGCKGNFPRLVRLAKKTFIFPKINNQRSMLYIGNLCEFIRLIIENESSGVFFPQNPEYFCTSNLIKQIAALNGKGIHLTKIFNWLILMLWPLNSSLKKLFGNLAYDKSLSTNFVYQVYDNNYLEDLL